MANHRADGRATVRTLRANPGSHRDGALPAGAVKAGVLGVLATATIAAPLAAAAAGIDETVAPGDVTAAQQPQSDQAAPGADPSSAPVALPEAGASASVTQAAADTRESDEDASRSQERTAPSETKDAAEGKTKKDAALDIEVELPEPEPVETAQTAASGESAPASSGGYIDPVNAPITSGFGGRMHPVLGYFKGHDGVDFGASCGAPVKAVRSGKVVSASYQGASGNRVEVDHGNGVVTGYFHLQGFNTSVGSTVEQGETIGYVGSTGRSTGCHLHFAKMDEAGNYSNPMSILR
ncbi:M23 family metallopeptidase [Brachybacterium fresconis]|uniref:Murein DD-endopeptidase MepM/ murein hydrolase activator NlpD n=1 Tax=Brachybacterium fresconis TaxID=173363 RepID=A0ABS4YGY7_9MICO|nr:murein DD-endopeptidase MepM/ murein hydrolase activator NlpD [Brachybacterium fresconis]